MILVPALSTTRRVHAGPPPPKDGSTAEVDAVGPALVPDARAKIRGGVAAAPNSDRPDEPTRCKEQGRMRVTLRHGNRGLSPRVLPKPPDAFNRVYRAPTWATPGTTANIYINSGRVHPVQSKGGSFYSPSDVPVQTSRAGGYVPAPPSVGMQSVPRSRRAVTAPLGKHRTRRAAESIHIWHNLGAREGHHGRSLEHEMAVEHQMSHRKAQSARPHTVDGEEQQNQGYSLARPQTQRTSSVRARTQASLNAPPDERSRRLSTLGQAPYVRGAAAQFSTHEFRFRHAQREGRHAEGEAYFKARRAVNRQLQEQQRHERAKGWQKCKPWREEKRSLSNKKKFEVDLKRMQQERARMHRRLEEQRTKLERGARRLLKDCGFLLDRWKDICIAQMSKPLNLRTTSTKEMDPWAQLVDEQERVCRKREMTSVERLDVVRVLHFRVADNISPEHFID